MAKKELSASELSAAFAKAERWGSGSGKGQVWVQSPSKDSFSDMRFVMIPDGTSPAAKFAKKHYGAGGAESIFYSTTIPVTGWGKAGNERYAEAFASVLRSAGIEAKATDWADTDD